MLDHYYFVGTLEAQTWELFLLVTFLYTQKKGLLAPRDT